MKTVTFKHVFSLFLETLGFHAVRIIPKANRLKAKAGNRSFTLIQSSKKIILTEYGVDFNGYEYTKTEKVYVYKIKEDMGDVKVIDENSRTVICLNSNHEIVKIDSAKTETNSKPVRFEGKAEYLKYRLKEKEDDLKHPALF